MSNKKFLKVVFAIFGIFIILILGLLLYMIKSSKDYSQVKQKEPSDIVKDYEEYLDLIKESDITESEVKEEIVEESNTEPVKEHITLEEGAHLAEADSRDIIQEETGIFISDEEEKNIEPDMSDIDVDEFWRDVEIYGYHYITNWHLYETTLSDIDTVRIDNSIDYLIMKGEIPSKVIYKVVEFHTINDITFDISLKCVNGLDTNGLFIHYIIGGDMSVEKVENNFEDM